MKLLLANPAFQTYAVCSAILVLKMLFSAVYTGTRRQATQGFINAEDATRFGGGVEAGTVETPEVAHALRIQRNDGENIPLFLAIGLLYVLCGASRGGAFVLCWSFTLARIAHTYFYTRHMQPHRAISFGIAALALVLMSLNVLWKAL
jgi:glutathione S-transferase